MYPPSRPNPWLLPMPYFGQKSIWTYLKMLSWPRLWTYVQRVPTVYLYLLSSFGSRAQDGIVDAWFRRVFWPWLATFNSSHRHEYITQPMNTHKARYRRPSAELQTEATYQLCNTSHRSFLILSIRLNNWVSCTHPPVRTLPAAAKLLFVFVLPRTFAFCRALSR